MAPLACLLQGQGHIVSGSDGPLYPPMSNLLEAAGIRPLVGFRPENLDGIGEGAELDLVIVGNAVPRSNPEAVECERRGLARLSMPEALARFLLADRRPLVVAGTHGKTTTTALAAWVWSAAGRAPGFLVGGVPLNLGVSFEQGAGERFLLEGDEYNAAYFDRGAKFLHYRPETLLLTSVEHDHADLYPTPESLLAAYSKLVAMVPESGAIVAWGDSEDVRRVTRAARAPVIFYGEREENDVCLLGVPRNVGERMRFRLREDGGAEFEVDFPLWGVHNATNALAVWAAARRDGIDAVEVGRALAGFRGVARRQQLIGTGWGVAVVDDFAHHPTAVEKTLESLRLRFPGRRLLVCFEPRSLTAGRAFFMDGYLRAFRLADSVFFAPIFHRDRLALEERLDLGQLVAALDEGGVRATACASIEAVAAAVEELARPGDVVVTMSSGAFGGLAARLAAAFELRGS